MAAPRYAQEILRLNPKRYYPLNDAFGPPTVLPIASPSTYLTISGQAFSYNGQAVLLRGLNFNNETSLSFGGAYDLSLIDTNEADYQKVSGWGLNTIRFGMDYKWWNDSSTAFFTLLDQHVAWAKKYQLWMYPVLFMAPDYWSGGFTTSGQATFWASSADATAVQNFWVAFATHYATEHTIIGYDILNEPSPASDSSWITLAQNVRNAITAVDTNHFVIVQASISNATPTITGSNVVYSVHHYGSGDNYPGATPRAWTAGVPLIVGEFGSQHSDTNAATFAQTELTRYEADGVHWTYFDMHEGGTTKYGLFDNWNAGDFSGPWQPLIDLVGQGRIIHDASANAQHGTQRGLVSSRAGFIRGIPTLAATPDGSSGFISIPTTGLPTGANPWTIMGWFTYGTLPGGYQSLMSLGVGTHATADLFYDVAAVQLAIGFGSSDNLYTGLVLTAGHVYYCAAIYNGTTITLIQYDATSLGAAHTASESVVLNITYGTAGIGVDPSSLWFSGGVAQVSIHSTALTADQVAWLYRVGLGAGVALGNHRSPGRM